MLCLYGLSIRKSRIHKLEKVCDISFSESSLFYFIGWPSLHPFPKKWHTNWTFMPRFLDRHLDRFCNTAIFKDPQFTVQQCVRVYLPPTFSVHILASCGGLNENGPEAPMFEYLTLSWWICSGRIRRCSLVEEVCHWGLAFEVHHKPMLFPVSVSPWPPTLPHACGSRMGSQLLFQSNACLLPVGMPPTMRILNPWSCKSPINSSINCFGHGAS